MLGGVSESLCRRLKLLLVLGNQQIVFLDSDDASPSHRRPYQAFEL